MEETAINSNLNPVKTIMEETRQDADEIDRSFEIISKDDLLLKTDVTNNNTIVQKTAPARSMSDTTHMQRKYSREELLSFKKTVPDFKPQISVDAIFKPNNSQLDFTLAANLQMRTPQRQNSNPRDPSFR